MTTVRYLAGPLPNDSASAHRFLHERADPCLFGGGQLLQREGGRPQGAFVEVRRIAEAERRVPRVKLLRTLEEIVCLLHIGSDDPLHREHSVYHSFEFFRVWVNFTVPKSFIMRQPDLSRSVKFSFHFQSFFDHGFQSHQTYAKLVDFIWN